MSKATLKICSLSTTICFICGLIKKINLTLRLSLTKRSYHSKTLFKGGITLEAIVGLSTATSLNLENLCFLAILTSKKWSLASGIKQDFPGTRQHSKKPSKAPSKKLIVLMCQAKVTWVCPTSHTSRLPFSQEV